MFYYIDFASQNQPQNSRISGRNSRKVGFRQAKAMVIVMELWQHTKTMDIEHNPIILLFVLFSALVFVLFNISHIFLLFSAGTHYWSGVKSENAIIIADAVQKYMITSP